MSRIDSLEMMICFQVHPSQGSVRTMTVEEGHVLNIDGISSNANKYKKGPTSTTAADRTMSAVSRGSAFQFAPTSDVEEGGGGGGGGGGDGGGGHGGGHGGPHADRESVLSGASGRSKTTSQLEAAAKLPWYRGVTCNDVKEIMPTVLILVGGLLIMIIVIPYAFSSVMKQLEAEAIYEAAREQARQLDYERRKAIAADAAGNTTSTAAAAYNTTLLSEVVTEAVNT